MSGIPPEPIIGFVRALRSAGVAVPINCTVTYAAALGRVDLTDRRDLYWTGRATLIRRPEHIEIYDAVFDGYWGSSSAVTDTMDQTAPVTLVVDDADEQQPNDDDGGETDDPPGETLELRFSAAEILRRKDFADWTDEELAESQRLMAGLRLVGEPQRSLRRRPSGARGHRPDIRRTVRLALASGGEPIRRQWSSPSERPRRLVLILDVSGSMEPYARALVRFAHAAVIGRQRVEVFALGTRLTRITRELSQRNVDDAVSNAAERVVDWSGGTRIGEGLRTFNDRWGQRGAARGAVVVILSDGWDRGDPDDLDNEMARLGRLAHRIVWVNPLKVTPGYAPLARGMAAALPHINHFVEGHNLIALEELASIIGATDGRRGDQTVHAGTPTVVRRSAS